MRDRLSSNPRQRIFLPALRPIAASFSSNRYCNTDERFLPSTSSTPSCTVVAAESAATPETEAGRVNLIFLMGGLKYTLLLSITAISISFVLGLLVALPGLSENRLPRLFNRVYVEVFRSIPLLVGIFWVYLGLPILTGVTLSPFWSAVIALSVLDSAFEAEIFRGGIQSIDRGQLEAADSIGLGYFDRMRYVILPQAIRRMLPPMGNQFVYMLKMSSLASVIGVYMEHRLARQDQR